MRVLVCWCWCCPPDSCLLSPAVGLGARGPQGTSAHPQREGHVHAGVCSRRQRHLLHLRTGPHHPERGGLIGTQVWRCKKKSPQLIKSRVLTMLVRGEAHALMIQKPKSGGRDLTPREPSTLTCVCVCVCVCARVRVNCLCWWTFPPEVRCGLTI